MNKEFISDFISELNDLYKKYGLSITENGQGDMVLCEYEESEPTDYTEGQTFICPECGDYKFGSNIAEDVVNCHNECCYARNLPRKGNFHTFYYIHSNSEPITNIVEE